MIAFATLLLGLIVGPQPIELLVGGSVARVEIFLDGKLIETLEDAPWTFVCDFGQRLSPHEIVAISYDADGGEIGRDRQWINMPRQPAEAAVALEGGQDGKGLVAHLTWESVLGSEPIAITATFDGREIPIADPRRIEIPPFDTTQLHHFRAEIEFSENLSSTVEATFAGTYVDRVNTELTAVPVILERRAREPRLEQLAGRFTKDSRPLMVRAVEDGPAEIVIVRDEDARRDLSRLHRHDQEALWRRARGGAISDRGSARTKLPLPDDLKVRFLWPASELQERPEYALHVFSPSRQYTGRDGGLFWLLTFVREPFVTAEERRYADAIAAAGMLAAARNRRRAVVLLLDEDSEDHDSSQFTLPAVGDYLEILGVPLHVWSTSRGMRCDGSGREVIDVSSFSKLSKAVHELYSVLDRQRIVWLDGTHLPQDIVFSGKGLPLRLSH